MSKCKRSPTRSSPESVSELHKKRDGSAFVILRVLGLQLLFTGSVSVLPQAVNAADVNAASAESFAWRQLSHGRLVRTRSRTLIHLSASRIRIAVNEPTRCRKCDLHAALVKLRATWQSASQFSVNSSADSTSTRVAALPTSSRVDR